MTSFRLSLGLFGSVALCISGCPGRNQPPATPDVTDVEAVTDARAAADVTASVDSAIIDSSREDRVEPQCRSRAEPPIRRWTFHGDRARTGWLKDETELTPARLSAGRLQHVWDSPQLDSVTINGTVIPPHIFGSPLYIDDVRVDDGMLAGRRLDLVFVATTNSWVYAVNATANACDGPRVEPGRIVWRRRLGTPRIPPGFERGIGLDGGIPIGSLSTPVIDMNADPPALYVTALDVEHGWQIFAIDVRNGRVLPRWPVAINNATLNPLNHNPPAMLAAADGTTQRAALNLSPDGSTVYFGFSSANWSATGWTVAVDTQNARIRGAFATSASGAADGRGGVWGPGGPAIDADGLVYATTGNGTENAGPRPGWWGSSLLRWSPSLELRGSYNPFNYCELDLYDMDLAASSPTLLDLDPALTSTPRLTAFGGKQGTVYLVDRDRLAGASDRRPRCDRRPDEDGSLLPPGVQPHFGSRGPLHVFGPWTTMRAMVDFARMHSTLTSYRSPDGATFLFATGATKAAEADSSSVAPGLYRLRVVTNGPTQPAYLSIDGVERETRLWNPGSAVVTSARDGSDAIVWVTDPNQRRSAWLVGAAAARPVLYAFDARTLRLLYRSQPMDLFVGGKYNSPTIAHGTVFVGTDRVQAFGIR